MDNIQNLVMHILMYHRHKARDLNHKALYVTMLFTRRLYIVDSRYEMYNVVLQVTGKIVPSCTKRLRHFNTVQGTWEGKGQLAF